MSLSISSTFDSGNIIVKDASDPANVRLAIEKDNESDFYQWFHFRVTGEKGQKLRLIIENAGSAAYPKDGRTTRLSSRKTRWSGAGCRRLMMVTI